MEIYIVISNNTKIKDFTSIGVSQECYKTKEQAIEFCESRLTEQEILKNRNAKRRNLQSWYEFFGKDTIYEIKILNLK